MRYSNNNKKNGFKLLPPSLVRSTTRCFGCEFSGSPYIIYFPQPYWGDWKYFILIPSEIASNCSHYLNNSPANVCTCIYNKRSPFKESRQEKRGSKVNQNLHNRTAVKYIFVVHRSDRRQPMSIVNVVSSLRTSNWYAIDGNSIDPYIFAPVALWTSACLRCIYVILAEEPGVFK